MQRILLSAFDHCSESCGWVAAVVAALSYGTFGVPIKETVNIDVHPLVLQSYKTFTMFLMAWLVAAMGEPVRYTPWGILSGLLWVLGGTGGIYGIRNAGMSVAVGTWSSCMVCINFLVGIILFREPVASIPSTLAAFVLLGCGLVGMSIFSAPTAPTSLPLSADSSVDSNNPLMETELTVTNQEDFPATVQVPTSNGRPMSIADNHVTVRSPYRSTSRSSEDLDSASVSSHDALGGPAEASHYEKDGLWRRESKKYRLPEPLVSILNNSRGLTKRQLGIIGAVLNGLLAGSSLVPIHYAKKQGFGGSAYILSFATGALLSNSLIWLLWFTGKLTLTWMSEPTNNTIDPRSMAIQTYESMPSFHLRQLWKPGFSAGTLLAIAMFGSIMSITYLGQGVGNSVIQSKILISGLWGICWYKEISGRTKIAKWFASAVVAVTGILWLSYEKINAKSAVAVLAELHLSNDE